MDGLRYLCVQFHKGLFNINVLRISYILIIIVKGNFPTHKNTSRTLRAAGNGASKGRINTLHAPWLPLQDRRSVRKSTRIMRHGRSFPWLGATGAFEHVRYFTSLLHSYQTHSSTQLSFSYIIYPPLTDWSPNPNSA